MADPDDYEVGYGKPPKHTRFKKGRSGNPKGRPKGAKSISTLIEKALSKKITAIEAGQTVIMTKREAFSTGLVNRAIKGDHRAAEAILKLETRRTIAAAAEPEIPISPQDATQELVDRFQRIAKQHREDRAAFKAELVQKDFPEEHFDFLFGPPEDRLREGVRAALLDARARGVDLRRLAELSDHGDIVQQILAEILDNKSGT